MCNSRESVFFFSCIAVCLKLVLFFSFFFSIYLFLSLSLPFFSCTFKNSWHHLDFPLPPQSLPCLLSHIFQIFFMCLFSCHQLVQVLSASKLDGSPASKLESLITDMSDKFLSPAICLAYFGQTNFVRGQFHHFTSLVKN